MERVAFGKLPAVAAIVELAGADVVEGFVIFVVEILVGEIEDVALGSAFGLNLGSDAIEREVGGDDVVGGVLAVAGAVGCLKPAAEGIAFGYGSVGSAVLEGADGGVFLHLLCTDDGLTVSVVISQRIVGLVDECGHIGHGIVVGYNGNGSHAAGLSARVGHFTHRSVLGHEVGKRVGCGYHRLLLGYLNGAGEGAVGILCEDVGCVIGLAVGCEGAERRCQAQVYVAIDVELEEVRVLLGIEVGEAQLAVGTVDVDIHVSAFGIGGYRRADDHPVAVTVTFGFQHPATVAACGTM